MASTDQGSSQRRGAHTAFSTVNQAQATSPAGGSSESLLSPALSPSGGHDSSAQVRRKYQAGLTQVGTGDPESPNQGTGYFSPALSPADPHDVGSARRGPSQVRQTFVGTYAFPETPNRGTDYYRSFLGSPELLQTKQTYYKLRAQDLSQLPTVAYVYWTSTSPTLSGFPGGGAALSNLTVLSVYQTNF